MEFLHFSYISPRYGFLAGKMSRPDKQTVFMVTEPPVTFRTRIKYLFQGFLIGSIPIFIITILYSNPLLEALGMSIFSGIICSIISCFFGKRAVNILFKIFTDGGV